MEGRAPLLQGNDLLNILRTAVMIYSEAAGAARLKRKGRDSPDLNRC